MDWNLIITGLVSTAAGLIVGILGHRRATKVDARSAQSGVASDHRAGTEQVIEGLNTLIDQLQEDNSSFRVDLKDLAARLVVITAERDALKLEVARLRKRYGVNGDET